MNPVSPSEFEVLGPRLQGSVCGVRSGGMKTLRPLAIAVVAAATVVACSPKKDTANPDNAASCTEEAMVCEDGSTVVRQGPDCEFAACPGEAAAAGSEDLDDGDDEAEADAEADAEAEAEPDVAGGEEAAE